MSYKYDETDLIVRRARKEDMVAVAEMIQELANYERMPDGPKMSVKDLQRDGFESQPPAFNCLVAESIPDADEPDESSELVGYALYFPTYSTWEGRAVMLEDLYVRPSERRRGVGRRLFEAVAKEVKVSGSCRLDFHVLEWNDARCFYELEGAVNLTKYEQWCYYRLSGDALARAAQSGDIQ